MSKSMFSKMALVRDLIPDIIKQQGCDCSYTIIDDDNAYKTQLKKKLEEEVQEVQIANTTTEIIEELADCLEVINCLANAYNIDMEDVIKCQTNKCFKKGSFKKRLFLKTYEKNV